MAISYELGPQASAPAATTAASAPSASLRCFFIFSFCRPVIDFLEQIVVLTNLDVVGIKSERLIVGGTRFLELALVLVRNRQIVEGGGVRRVDLDRLLPTIDGLPPEAELRNADAEGDLLFRVAASIGKRGRRPQGGSGHHHRDADAHGR